MDFTSPEFYTIAFVVAMALVALLMGKVEKKPASTHIVQLGTVPDENEDCEDAVTLELAEGGRVRIGRTGLSIGAEETVNLVFTIRDGECTIVEKKGVKRRGSRVEPVKGMVEVKCLRPIKYKMRYESQITSAWASFTIDASKPAVKRVNLNY